MTRLTQEQLDEIRVRAAGDPCPVDVVCSDDVPALLEEIRLLHRDLKDSRKDAAHLLDRNVRLSAAARQYASVAGHDDDDLSSYQELMAVLNEVPK